MRNNNYAGKVKDILLEQIEIKMHHSYLFKYLRRCKTQITAPPKQFTPNTQSPFANLPLSTVYRY